MAAQLRIVERHAGEVTILDLSGRLEIADGDVEFASIVDRLLAAGRVKLLVNMAQVTRIDSGGVGVLVSKYVGACRRGGDIKLMHLTSRTHRVLSVTRLLTVFANFDDEAQALASFGTRD